MTVRASKDPRTIIFLTSWHSKLELVRSIMSNLKIGPLVKSITLALIFFVLGRIVVDQMGTTGVWLIFGLLAVFYGAIWVMRRSRRKGG